MLTVAYLNHTRKCAGVTGRYARVLRTFGISKGRSLPIWKIHLHEKNTASQFHSSFRAPQLLGPILTLSTLGCSGHSSFLRCLQTQCSNLSAHSCLQLRGRCIKPNLTKKPTHLWCLKISTWPKATREKYMHIGSNIPGNPKLDHL